MEVELYLATKYLVRGFVSAVGYLAHVISRSVLRVKGTIKLVIEHQNLSDTKNLMATS